jgi:hypothetical protein
MYMRPGHDPSKAAGEDRRQEQRLDVQRPCKVRPAAAPAVEMTGITENVSRSGMLVKFENSVISDLLPAVGEGVRITFDLPRNANFTPRSLECTGRIVRASDKAGDRAELAVEVHTMRIRSRRKQASPPRESRDLVQ